jgi:hypothetical protein
VDVYKHLLLVHPIVFNPPDKKPDCEALFLIIKKQWDALSFKATKEFPPQVGLEPTSSHILFRCRTEGLPQVHAIGL